MKSSSFAFPPDVFRPLRSAERMDADVFRYAVRRLKSGVRASFGNASRLFRAR